MLGCIHDVGDIEDTFQTTQKINKYNINFNGKSQRQQWSTFLLHHVRLHGVGRGDGKIMHHRTFFQTVDRFFPDEPSAIGRNDRVVRKRVRPSPRKEDELAGLWINLQPGCQSPFSDAFM